jgi:hypothetical protein
MSANNSSSTNKSGSTLDKTEKSLSDFHHNKVEPAIEKLGEKLQPTADKMESGAENTRDWGNQKIVEGQEKMNSSSSSSSSTGLFGGGQQTTSTNKSGSTLDKTEKSLSDFHHNKVNPAIEKLGDKLKSATNTMEGGAEKIRDWGNKKISEMQDKTNSENKKPVNSV